MVDALRLVTTDPQVRRVFEIATHKVEYTRRDGSGAAAPPGRAQCLRDRFREGAARCGAPRRASSCRSRAATAAQGLHALISGLIQDWLLDPAAFDLVRAGRRTFRVYLAGLGFERPGLRADAPLPALAQLMGDEAAPSAITGAPISLYFNG